MDRRDALKALTLLASTTGLAVTPVTTQELQGVELVLLRMKGRASCEAIGRLRASWLAAVTGTALETTRVIVFDEQVEAEFVRTR